MKIPTTMEMDGLFTEEDIANRFYFMAACIDCTKWTKQDIRNKRRTPCTNCGSERIDNQSNHWYSIRTWSASKKVSKKDLEAQRGKRTT